MDNSLSTQGATEISSMTTVGYVGNLRSDITENEISTKLLTLFLSIGIGIEIRNIQVYRKSPRKPAYSFVSLQDEKALNLAIEKLNGLDKTATDLVFDGKKLLVAPKVLRKLGPGKKNPRRKQKSHYTRGSVNKTQIISTENLLPPGYVETSAASSTRKLNCEECLQGIKSAAFVNGISVDESHKCSSYRDSQQILTVNDSNGKILQESFQESHSRNPEMYGIVRGYDYGECYFVRQRLKAEDRLTEYKKGGGRYLEQNFKNHVAKYICAFLNSEGGSLVIGVSDDCRVCGIHCNSQKEDHLRLEVDDIIKGFNPPVFPNVYTVKFIPVYQNPVPPLNLVSPAFDTHVTSKPFQSALSNPDDIFPSPIRTSTSQSTVISIYQDVECSNIENTSKNSKPSELKVIEISVRPPTSIPPTLYENNKGEVYIRRDGSIQGPLKASQILEWSRMNLGESYQMNRKHLEREIDSVKDECKRKQEEIEMNMKLVNELVKQKEFIEDQHRLKEEGFKKKEQDLEHEIERIKEQSRNHEMSENLEKVKKSKSTVCVLV